MGRDAKEAGQTADNTAMDTLLLWMLLAGGVWMFKRQEERQRIVLLSGFLSKYRLEERMTKLTDGYLRAIGEADPERADPIWHNLSAIETALLAELQQLAGDLKEVWGERLRVSRWSVSLPMATRLFPQHSFDFRSLVDVLAQGLEATLRNESDLSRRDRAFRATAELLLFQHSCHWFCRSRSVASARLLARHRTAYEQVLTAVSPSTRQAYLGLVKGDQHHA